jgi:nuclear pore complex protein Nup62
MLINFMYVCMYVCMCMYICMYACMCALTRICVYAHSTLQCVVYIVFLLCCVYVFSYVCTYYICILCVCVHTHTSVSTVYIYTNNNFISDHICFFHAWGPYKDYIIGGLWVLCVFVWLVLTFST